MDLNADIDLTGKMCDYNVGKEIGRGAYAVVKQCTHKPSGTKMAIKIYEKHRLLDSVINAAVKREIDILKKLNHKYILKLYEVIEGLKQVKFIKLEPYLKDMDCD